MSDSTMTVHNPNNLPMIPITDLLPTQGDLKDLTKDNYNKLRNNIKSRGFIVPVFVWEDENAILHMLDGHQRRRVLEAEGWNEPVPYLKVPAENMQEAMAKLLEITSQYGTITQEGVDQFIATYQLDEQSVLEATNYDALNYGLTKDEEDVEEDEAPELDQAEAISQPGMVYQLGRHRLMCGSATEPEDVKKLVTGKVSLIHTDPPYGVDYTSKKLGKIMNDELKGDSLYQFTHDAFEVIKEHIEDEAAVYCWYEDKFRHVIQTALEDSGYEFKQNLIWNKGMNLSGADYQKAHENVLYLQLQGSKAKWLGERDKKTILGNKRTDFAAMSKKDLVEAMVTMQSQSTVWEIDRDTVTKYVHPTQKPVRIAARVIQNSSEPEDNVYDGFAGSGSTLMACEQTNRTCFSMELDPKYVDVIRKRYAKFVSGDELPENWEELTPGDNS